MYSTQQFQEKLPVIGNGNAYARIPEEPGYIEQPSSEEYSKGASPLETLPAQWWNWLNNQYTKRINDAFNNTDGVFTNLFNELTNVLINRNITPSPNSNNQLLTAIDKPNCITYTTDNSSESPNITRPSIIRVWGRNVTITLPTENVPFGMTVIIHSARGQNITTVVTGGSDIELKYDTSVMLYFTNTKWDICLTNTQYTMEKLYPIGTIYMNSETDENPKTLLGFGNWRQINDRFISAYGSSLFTTQTGGNSTVILTNSNLPAHNHNAVFTGARLNVNDAFWAVTQILVGVQPGAGQATLADNKPPFKNAHWQNYTNKAVTTYAHEGINVDCLSGSIGFDYTPEGSVTIEDTGEGDAFSIIPPYYAVYTWRRTS